jgi:hypothetical protein
VINQDFYTKSLGNKSSPRNDDMLDLESLRDKSLDGDEGRTQNGEDLGHQVSQAPVQEPRRHAARPEDAMNGDGLE